MDDKSYNVRVPKRWARIAMIVGVTALIVAPLTAMATHGFTDVPNSHTFHNDISWLADADVTKGCNPPTNDEFCPDDVVTRGQMAAFMHRLADNQVVDAGELDGQDGTAYETRVAAASCGVTVDDTGTTIETSCIPASGGQIGSEINAEVLIVTIDAPASGALQVSSTALTTPTVAFQFALNGSCPQDVVDLINDALNNHIWGNADGFSTAAHLTAQVPAGDHSIRLCGYNSSTTDSADVVTSSLNVQWTQGGSVDVASDSASAIGSGSGAAPLGGDSSLFGG